MMVLGRRVGVPCTCRLEYRLASLGLKLFYLRTRERSLSQQEVADQIGVRQATLSHIEQGVSLPACALLRELCKFFDVTPTFLIDEERSVVPLPSERWQVRNGLVTVGMWAEVPRDRVAELDSDRLLCPLLAGEAFYDAEAAALRRATDTASLTEHFEGKRREDRELEERLERELKLHPRRRRRARRDASGEQS